MKLRSPIRRRHSRIEIIPLIDVMFFLLAAFMMVSLSLDRTQNIRVNLPPSIAAQPDFKPDLMSVAVDKAGGVWFEKRAITLPELGTILSNRLHFHTNVPVYISGDRDTTHGAMTGVYQALRAAGIQKVAFAVGPPSDSATR